MNRIDAPRPGDIATGLNRLEGYLLLQAERDRAADRARRFAGRLDWLTVAQREEVERLYAQDQLALTEQTLRTVARRCEELRAEYRQVYRRLRRRLLVAALLGAVAVAVMAAAALAAG